MAGSPSSLPGDRLVRGTFARWTETTGWVDRDGLPLPEMVFVIGYTTVLQRWKDQKAEVITAHPLPDPKQLNATIPDRGMGVGPGRPAAPAMELTFVIYMIDLKTGAIFTYANSTAAQSSPTTQLEEQIGVMRLLRGEHVLPIVRLEKRPMKTQFGMKSRPHLQIIEWRTPGGGGPKLAPQPPSPQLSGPATAVAPVTAPAHRPDCTAPISTAAATAAAAHQLRPHRCTPTPRHRRFSTTRSRSNRSRLRNSSPTSCRRGPEASERKHPQQQRGRRLASRTFREATMPKSTGIVETFSQSA